MEKFIPSTRKQQKTIYGFINQYSLYLQSKSDLSISSELYTLKAKIELKRLYMELIKDIKVDNPLLQMREVVKLGIDSFAEELIVTGEDKTEDLLNVVDGALREFIEDLALQLAPSEAFSLALAVMSKERATKFIQFLIDYFIDNEISLGKELHKMVVEGEHDKFIFACLRNKKCAVCGNDKVDLDHWDTVASEFGTYEKDDGSGTYISLCRKHHTEKHNITKNEFYRKYKKKGIRLSEYQIKELKKVYKNHFKAFSNKQTY